MHLMSYQYHDHGVNVLDASKSFLEIDLSLFFSIKSFLMVDFPKVICNRYKFLFVVLHILPLRVSSLLSKEYYIFAEESFNLVRRVGFEPTTIKI